MEKSPNQYIKWRFENGIDKELLEKETKKVDKEQMVKHGIELICGRQKLKRSYKYEVKYIGKSFNDTRWVPKEDLEEMGLLRLCEQYDDYEAARLANAYLPELNTNAVEKHLEAFGIIKEIGTYSTIKGLSGGQKVKVVLAAAMWILPHVLILDEPTNYLDVQSMQALKVGIRDFSGGVMMVTHNKEFYENLCDEVWEMDSGYLKCRRNRTGEVAQLETPDDSVEDVSANGSSQEQLDKPSTEKEEKERKPRIKKLTRKEKLKKEKIREAKLNKYGPKPDGTPWSSDEEVETNIVIGSVNVAKSG
jgi:elongation factor 3